MSAETDLIAQAIGRLNGDYDAALQQAAGDESMVTLYLSAEWTVLARRTLELIIAEVRKRVDLSDRAGPRAETCAGCGGRTWFLMADPVTLHRYAQCASCGRSVV